MTGWETHITEGKNHWERQKVRKKKKKSGFSTHSLILKKNTPRERKADGAVEHHKRCAEKVIQEKGFEEMRKRAENLEKVTEKEKRSCKNVVTLSKGKEKQGGEKGKKSHASSSVGRAKGHPKETQISKSAKTTEERRVWEFYNNRKTPGTKRPKGKNGRKVPWETGTRREGTRGATFPKKTLRGKRKEDMANTKKPAEKK